MSNSKINLFFGWLFCRLSKLIFVDSVSFFYKKQRPLFFVEKTNGMS